ncbi:hypothetical protein K443DRAFT_11492 [Laccaria amethystina LaAM-08-1]|uniref:Unplaced genomic scaffold K443scaffold_226, whole genome shotgun sequence n=1 Tax=Laccaria amethystina LaAM-08-1 TaxID=1095629 RepID=A0A0C9WTK1_9AGAR|nr:hypothetical protein K443DRAFT_11492 [Laccaria amethystina LaAM-08-1]
MAGTSRSQKVAHTKASRARRRLSPTHSGIRNVTTPRVIRGSPKHKPRELVGAVPVAGFLVQLREYTPAVDSPTYGATPQEAFPREYHGRVNDSLPQFICSAPVRLIVSWDNSLALIPPSFTSRLESLIITPRDSQISLGTIDRLISKHTSLDLRELQSMRITVKLNKKFTWQKSGSSWISFLNLDSRSYRRSRTIGRRLSIWFGEDGSVEPDPSFNPFQHDPKLRPNHRLRRVPPDA